MSSNVVDFIKVSDVDERLIEKYKGIVPIEMIEFWRSFGFGSFCHGYLKSVNPEEFHDVLNEVSNYYGDGIVIFTTSMADLIIWSDDYVRIINLRYGKIKVLASRLDIFFAALESDKFKNDYLQWNPYPEAIKKYGEPNYDECFGYVPLLGLGGPEKVEHLDKVKIREHMLLISSLVGPFDF